MTHDVPITRDELLYMYVTGTKEVSLGRETTRYPILERALRSGGEKKR